MTPEQREQRFQTVFLFILSIIAIGAAFMWLRAVLVPFVLAIFFTFILTPLIDFQRKYLKFPHALAIITTIIFGIIGFILFGLLVSASVNQMAENGTEYVAKIEELLTRMTTTLELEQFGIDAKSIMNPAIANLKSNAGGFIGATINAILGLLSKGLLVFIFVLFLLIGKMKQKKPLTGVWQEGESRIKRYINTKVFISLITAVLVGGFFMILRIELALVFGLFVFLLNFIPSIGSIIATLLPVPVVLVSPDISAFKAIIAIAIPGVIQFVIGNVIEPKIMGDSLDLHPVAILMALIFWGILWGIVGMLLAAPLTAIMKIIFEKIEFTKPIAQLLAGRLAEEDN